MQPAQPSPARTTAPPATRVLVVDDHPLFRKGLIDLLADTPGLTVCGEAAGAAEALALASTTSPQVAIVDLSLGNESGLDLVTALTRTHPAVRVLVMSGFDERIHADRALKAGAAGYIMKDKPPGDLIDAVRRVATGKPYLSAETAERILTSLGGPHVAAARTPLDRLSAREQQVLSLMGRGMATRDIAGHLAISVKTVESHYAHIKDKIGAANARELMRVAVAWAEDHPL